MLGTARDSAETRMSLLNGEGQGSKIETVWNNCCHCSVTVDSWFWDFPLRLCLFVLCRRLVLDTFIHPVWYKCNYLVNAGGTKSTVTWLGPLLFCCLIHILRPCNRRACKDRERSHMYENGRKGTRREQAKYKIPCTGIIVTGMGKVFQY